MKMSDLLLEEQTKGTYAAVTFSADTVRRLVKFCKDNDIPNPLRPEKFHTTLLYSRKHLPDFEPLGKLDPPWIGTPAKFEIWDGQPIKDGGEPTKCLVLRFDCDKIVSRHNKMMKTHGATYDFDTYNPHITLSYNIGNIKAKAFSNNINDIGDIEIVNEYGEDLKLDWSISAA